MFDLLSKYRIDIDDWLVFIFQLLTFLPFLGYSVVIIKIFFQEIIREHKHRGAIPFLALGYIILSNYYIWTFVLNFGKITLNVKKIVLVSLNYYDNAEWYGNLIEILSLVVLFAFVVNFFKALSTLNSLEYGILGKSSLKEIYDLNGGDNELRKIKKKSIKRSHRKAVLEAIVRFFIAFLFIFIEHKLLSLEHSNDIIGLLSEIGQWGMLLYLLMYIWGRMFSHFDEKREKLPDFWYKYSLKQFGCGIVVCLIIWVLGDSRNYSQEIVRNGLPFVFLLCTGFSLLLVWYIIKNEYHIYIKKWS